MRPLIWIVLIGLLILFVLVANLGIAYLVYRLIWWAGAPKYVAVISGILYFAISGWVANLKRKQD